MDLNLIDMKASQSDWDANVLLGARKCNDYKNQKVNEQSEHLSYLALTFHWGHIGG